MTTSIVGGPKTWEGERDEEGYRTFYVERRIKGAKTDGPSNVMNTSGLALPGAPWSYDGDADSNVWCTGEMKVTPEVRDGSPNEYWTTRQKYTNKPLKRCQTSSIENPLDEPDKVSGSFTKYTKEAVYDRFGDPIVNSAFEQMRGPQVERDANRPNVTIEAASLSIKSGNACILRGGSEAIESNKALAKLVQQALSESGLPIDAVQMVQTTDREAVGHLIAMPEFVDVIIPRGGKSLVARVQAEAAKEQARAQAEAAIQRAKTEAAAEAERARMLAAFWGVSSMASHTLENRCLSVMVQSPSSMP